MTATTLNKIIYIIYSKFYFIAHFKKLKAALDAQVKANKVYGSDKECVKKAKETIKIWKTKFLDFGKKEGLHKGIPEAGQQYKPTGNNIPDYDEYFQGSTRKYNSTHGWNYYNGKKSL